MAKSARWFSLGATLVLGTGGSHGYEIIGRMAPEVASKPVPVVYWVKDGVTAEHQARALGHIREGFQRWEDIPTCGLRFMVADTLHGATQPKVDKGKFLVIVGNASDLTSGGATYASETGPGTWFGAVADNIEDIAPVAVHEIGHALGFGHTSIGQLFPAGTLPAMHWAVASPVPLADDIAAASLAYPDPVRSLRAETGCITGRLVSAGPPATGIGGMNVVAVDMGGKPVIGRLSAFYGLWAGRFDLCGIPPGNYDLRFLDGKSYRGLLNVDEPANIRVEAQVDNAPEPASLRRTVAAGDSLDLGDISVAIEPVHADSVAAESLWVSFRGRFLPMASTALPDAPSGKRYDAWIHLRGGVRGLQIRDLQGVFAANIPPGLTVKMEQDIRTTGDAVNGNAFLSVRGVPIGNGSYTLKIPIVDRRSVVDTVTLTLRVGTGVGIAGGKASLRNPARPRKEVDALGREPGEASGSAARPEYVHPGARGNGNQ